MSLFYRGKVFFTGLKGSSLYEAAINPEGEVISLKVYLPNEFGRLRALTLGPDGFFYFSTSNTDGRGKLQPGDDKIIRVNPKVFD